MRALRVLFPGLWAATLIAPSLAFAQFVDAYYQIPGNPNQYRMGRFDNGSVHWVRQNGTMNVTCGGIGSLVITMNGFYNVNVVGTDGINVDYSQGTSPGPSNIATLNLYCTANPNCFLEGNAGNDGDNHDTIYLCTKGANASCVPIGDFKCVKDPPSQLLIALPALSSWLLGAVALGLLLTALVFLRYRRSEARAA